MSPTVRGVHLVGSIPLRNTSEVFHTISKALPHHLRRVPDGETGERWYFARWQAPKIGEWPLVLNPLIRGFLKLSDPEPPTYTESEKLETLRDMEEKLQVGYDIAALESWEVFRKLKAEGVIGRNVRFLVALPSPVTITALYVRRGFQVEFEGVYGRVLLKALERIQEGIPPEELSVQWDCPFEFGMIDGAEFPGRDTEKWWEESMSEGVVRRLVRVRESVKEDVELGVHLCYGDQQGKHFIQPKNTETLVNVARGLLDHCKRPVDFIHLPVPKDRTDDAYFESLAGLEDYVRQGHEICLGLVHPNDLEGTRERIRAAGKVVPVFSVSSECGLGRRSQEEFQSVLDISLAVADPVGST